MSVMGRILKIRLTVISGALSNGIHRQSVRGRYETKLLIVKLWFTVLMINFCTIDILCIGVEALWPTPDYHDMIYLHLYRGGGIKKFLVDD